MVGIVRMVGMVYKSVGYGMFDMTVCMVGMVCMVTSSTAQGGGGSFRIGNL